MLETIERVQQAKRQSRVESLGIASTAPKLGRGALESHPALEVFSTSPSRVFEHVQVIILDEHDNEFMVAGSTFSRQWNLAKTPTQFLALPKTPNTIDDVQWLRTSLNLSMAEVATLFKVTRKAVYDWLDGSKPRTGLAERIGAMRALFERNLPEESRQVVRQFFDTPIEEKGTLLSILRDIDIKSLAGEGEATLKTLAPRIAQFSADINSKPTPHGNGYAHNDDIYRSL